VPVRPAAATLPPRTPWKAGTIYLVFADREAAGPGTLRLAEIIRQGVARECSRRAG
jgi:hypothetical protein